jgi:hypothetical protein
VVVVLLNEADEFIAVELNVDETNLVKIAPGHSVQTYVF